MGKLTGCRLTRGILSRDIKERVLKYIITAIMVFGIVGLLYMSYRRDSTATNATMTAMTGIYWVFYLHRLPATKA